MHDNIELAYVERGEGVAICDDKIVNLKSGDFFIAFPNQVHKYEGFPKGGVYYMLIIKPSHLSYYESVFFDLKPTTPKCHPDPDSNIFELLKIATSEYKKGTSINILESLFTTIFGMLLKHYELLRNKNPADKLSEILAYCNAHYKEDISVEQVCKALYISRSHLSHSFNGKMNITFNDYINSLRITEAVRLLSSGKYSVTEAALLSGISTPRTFYRAFRKIHGVTPSEFIKQY